MMLRRLPRLVFVLALGFSATSLRAAPPSDAASFISDLVNTALKTLENKNADEQARGAQFRQLLDDDFDMPRISKFVLGRYWNDASDQDRRQFEKLFEDYVVRSYAARFGEYSGETVKITNSRPESETSTIVQSQIVRPNGAPPAKVDWRVRKDASGFKIIDVDVEGVSMVLTQREQFSSVIQRNGGLAGLNRELEQKLASGDNSLAAPPLPKKE